MYQFERDKPIGEEPVWKDTRDLLHDDIWQQLVDMEEGARDFVDQCNSLIEDALDEAIRPKP